MSHYTMLYKYAKRMRVFQSSFLYFGGVFNNACNSTRACRI